jgi:outer membrane protein assembly factor BamE (lipoprotein component of BamABCDE complex)
MAVTGKNRIMIFGPKEAGTCVVEFKTGRRRGAAGRARMKPMNVLLAFLLAACTVTSFNWDKAKQVKLGMTEAELRALMGRPSSIKIRDDTQIWVWSYADSSARTRSVSFELKDGLVTAIPFIVPID